MDDDSRPAQAHVDRMRSRRRWRRWVLIVSVLVLMLTISFGACSAVGYRASFDGAQFAKTSIIAVAKPWDAEVLRRLASPELLAVSPPDQLRKFFTFVAARLGPVKRCGDVMNGSWRVFASASGLAVFTTHIVACEFERGSASVTTELVRREGVWSIVTIRFNSDLLIEANEK